MLSPGWQTARMPSTEPAIGAESAPRTARARARLELTREIKETARRDLERDGAAGISLRAVARELGMVSSAVYRYFASRDELLTALIVDAYGSIGEVAEQALSRAQDAGEDHGGQWLQVGRAVRAWATAHPQEWALVYGSPVVGYEAPQDTIEPAARIAVVLASIAAEAAAAGELATLPSSAPTPLVEDPVAELTGGRSAGPPDLPERALTMWISLIGTINFELFGHLHNVVTDGDRYFDAAMALAAETIGLRVTLDAPG